MRCVAISTKSRKEIDFSFMHNLCVLEVLGRKHSNKRRINSIFYNITCTFINSREGFLRL